MAANADANIPFIYFPPGKYRIAQSLTITKPLFFGELPCLGAQACCGSSAARLLPSAGLH